MKRTILSLILLILVSKVSAQTRITANDAFKHVGESVTICDKVYSSKLINGSNMALLNIGGYYPNQLLTIVIKGSDRKKFARKPELDFKGKEVCITGVIVDYKGKPEIIVSDPAQIQLNVIHSSMEPKVIY